ncbi:RbsD/FucU family protein [Bacillus sp. 1P06AnD]|uniref:RbsD/FucU family protein n=1 Tax=Bacillus sp. 1P06AnD TaxID=3132208 RepID=UPI0039A36434
MLKGIPASISPDLMKILMEMGHGDELVIADGNFPAASCANRLVRHDGHGTIPLLEDILTLFPLDEYVNAPAILMAVENGDTQPPIWEAYHSIISKLSDDLAAIAYVDRFSFYERARKAYAIIATSEKALYANILLKKGVIS